MDSDNRRVSASGLDMDSGYTSLSTPSGSFQARTATIGKPAHPLDALTPAEVHAAATACRAYVASSKPLLRFNAITLQVRYLLVEGRFVIAQSRALQLALCVALV